jgi:hypothetical protein
MVVPADYYSTSDRGYRLYEAPSLDRYWVGGSGNWSDTDHWSFTSGGYGGSSVPTNSDIVHIEGSFESDSVITIDTDVNCDSIDLSVIAYTNTIKLNCNENTINCLTIIIGRNPIDITNSIINTSNWFVNYEGSIISTTGSIINLISNPDNGGTAQFTEQGAHNYNNLNLDFNNIEGAEIDIIYYNNISFNNIMIIPYSNISTSLCVGNDNHIPDLVLTCNNFAVTGSKENNFHIDIESNDYFYSPSV